MATARLYLNNVYQKEVLIYPGENIIGRHPDNSIVLHNDNVSAQHALLIRTKSSLLIRDLGSTNGTFVNGQKITECELQDGDQVAIGNNFHLKLNMEGVSVKKRASVKSKTTTTNNEDADKTTIISAQKMKEFINKRASSSSLCTGNVSLAITDHKTGQTLSKNLSKPFITIGKTGADIEVETAWYEFFIPKIIAEINQSENGFFLTPKKKGKIWLNKTPLLVVNKLQQNDIIIVCNLEIKIKISQE